MSILLGNLKRTLGRGVYGAMKPLSSLQNDFEKLCLNKKYTEDSSEDEIDDPDCPHPKKRVCSDDMDNCQETKLRKPSGSSAGATSLSNCDAGSPCSKEEKAATIEVLPGGANFSPCPNVDPDCMQFKCDVGVQSYQDVNEIVATVEGFYIQTRQAVVFDDDRVLSTPLHALKVLSNKYGEKLNCFTYALPETRNRFATYRVEIYIGVFRGLGESRFKRIAAQMAALDALLKIENAIEGADVLPYAFLPGWRINNRVLQDAVDLCCQNGLQLPRYNIKSNVGDDSKPPIRVELFTGKRRLGIGESETIEIARKLAAKDFIESLTQTEYPEEEVAMGSLCTPYSVLIKENLKLHLTPEKLNWLFEMSNQGVSDEARGVDPIERDAISNQRQMDFSSLKVQINPSGDRKITIDSNAN